LVPVEREKFNTWLNTVVDAYKKNSAASSSSAHSRAGNAGAGIPKNFQVLIHTNQKKLKDTDEKKWLIIESLSGASTSVMLINDKTENLGSYLNPNEAEIGESFSILNYFSY